MGDNIWLSDEVKMCPHLLKNENLFSASLARKGNLLDRKDCDLSRERGSEKGEKCKIVKCNLCAEKQNRGETRKLFNQPLFSTA